MKKRTFLSLTLVIALLLLPAGCAPTGDYTTSKDYDTLLEYVTILDLPPQEDDDLAYRFSEGLSFVLRGDLYGFIDKEGTIVIEPAYSSSGFFHEGLAAVCKDGLHGYIDQQGQTVIPFQFENAYDFEDGIAPVCNDGKWFLIDRTGSPIDFDYSHTGQEDAVTLRDGYATYQDGDLRGYVDHTGAIALPAQYEQAHRFSDGLAFVTKDDKTICIDKTGRNVFPQWNIDQSSAWMFEDGVALLTILDGEEDVRTIAVNTQGDILLEVPEEYDTHCLYSEGVIVFYDRSTNKEGAMDLEGTVIIPPIFDILMPPWDGVMESYMVDTKIPFYIYSPIV